MGDPKETCRCRVSLVPFLYRFNDVKKKWEWRPRVKGDKVKRHEWVKVTATMQCSSKCTAKIILSVDGQVPGGTLSLSKTTHLVNEETCTHYQERIYWARSWNNGGQPHAVVTFRASADCDPCDPHTCTGRSSDTGRVTFVYP